MLVIIAFILGFVVGIGLMAILFAGRSLEPMEAADILKGSGYKVVKDDPGYRVFKEEALPKGGCDASDIGGN